MPFGAPAVVEGVDFSDHLNYLAIGYFCIGGDRFFLLPQHNYHQASDKLETLDITRLSQVVDGVLAALLVMTTT